MRSKILLLATVAGLAAVVQPSAAVAAQPAAVAPAKLLPVEQFRLPNGLKVVFHIDRSDPVVAVSLNAHVGSARETPGRTGFAHMFEHLFFLDSENVGKGGLDRLSARIGGSGANGSTGRDMTDYLQTVPKDALEKMIWAEADKLGFFINTVTPAVLAKEKQVVKNEKRQSYDNQPYGHTETVLVENLYPADHPYHWSVIGSLADLDAATLEDVRAFYRQWYVPNNVTLVIAGDFDPAQARGWVEKYFGEFASGPTVAPAAVRPANLAQVKRVFHEDNFAELPQLALAYPLVPAFHPDAAPIEMLVMLLTDGKKAPLNAVLVDERKLTDQIEASLRLEKVAGELYLGARGFEGVDLDQIKAGFDEGFARFERDGVDPNALARAKTQREVELYDGLGSVLGKVRRIAEYDLFTGNADYADREVAAIRAVTPADVMRVYAQYFKGRPYVASSFVPKGKPALALDGSTRANVVEEKIVVGAEQAVDASERATFARTPSRFDRTVEPPFGPTPAVVVPPVWQAALPNGLKTLGIEDRELPLVAFELSMPGGRLADDFAKPGAANLVARTFTRGTARRTPAEVEDLLKSLGGSIAADVGNENFVIRGETLARNFGATMNLLTEMMLEPRWDAEELALQKAATVGDIQGEMSSPNAIAARAFDLARFGPRHIFARSELGTEASVKAMSVADLKRYRERYLAPNTASFRVVGSVTQEEVASALAPLGSRWTGRAAALPDYPLPPAPTKPSLLFYDLKDAKQSVFAFGGPAPRRAEADYYPAVVANYILGGGGFASRLTQQLREGKGYTYGIRSLFAGGERYGTFSVTSGVRANVTYEAAQLTREILSNYATSFSPADLEVTKSFLTKARARAFETQSAKLGYLAAIADYGLPVDYPKREQAIVDAASVESVRAAAARSILPDRLVYVVVGDAKTQAGRLAPLGLGAPEMIRDDLERLNR